MNDTLDNFFCSYEMFDDPFLTVHLGDIWWWEEDISSSLSTVICKGSYYLRVGMKKVLKQYKIWVSWTKADYKTGKIMVTATFLPNLQNI